MPRTLIVWVGMLCAFLSLTYRADARVTAASNPRQVTANSYIQGNVVTDAEHVPLLVLIQAIDTDGGVAGSYDYMPALESGPYSIGPLEPGMYRLKTTFQVDRISTDVDAFTLGWYDQVLNQSQASNVQVTEGMTTTADFDLTSFAEVSGTVAVQQTRRPAAYNTTAYAVNEAGELVAITAVVGGRYTFQYLGAGTYRIGFSGYVEPPPSDCTRSECSGTQVYDPLELPAITIERGERIEDADVTLSLLGQQSNTFTFLPLVSRSPRSGDRVWVGASTITSEFFYCGWHVDGEITNTTPYTVEQIEVSSPNGATGDAAKPSLAPGETTTYSITVPEDTRTCETIGEPPFGPSIDVWATIR